jgi:hypothetical protein
MFQLLRQSLFATFAAVVLQVERHELRPRKLCLGLWWVYVGFKVREVVRGQVLISQLQLLQG